MKKFNMLIGLCVLLTIGCTFYESRFVRNFDQEFRENIMNIRSEPVNELVLFFTHIGDAKVLGTLCVVSVIGLFIFRKVLNGFLLITSLGVSYGLNKVLKSVFERERPLENRLIEEDGFSFPSGNAMVGTAFYLFAAYLIYQKFQKSWILWVGTILPFLLGLSRVYVGVHYPSDIIAGYSIGILCCICLVWLSTKMKISKPVTKPNQNTAL